MLVTLCNSYGTTACDIVANEHVFCLVFSAVWKKRTPVMILFTLKQIHDSDRRDTYIFCSCLETLKSPTPITTTSYVSTPTYHCQHLSHPSIKARLYFVSLNPVKILFRIEQLNYPRLVTYVDTDFVACMGCHRRVGCGTEVCSLENCLLLDGSQDNRCGSRRLHGRLSCERLSQRRAKSLATESKKKTYKHLGSNKFKK